MLRCREAMEGARRAWDAVAEGARGLVCHMQAKLVCARGQGTTEYAILVGVQASG